MIDADLADLFTDISTALSKAAAKLTPPAVATADPPAGAPTGTPPAVAPASSASAIILAPVAPVVTPQSAPQVVTPVSVAPVATPVVAPLGPPSALPAVGAHPRFWGSAQESAELCAKATTAEGKSIVTSALATAKAANNNGGDRMLCAAFVFRFGAQLGVDPATVAACGTTAVSDLVAMVHQTPTGLAFQALSYDWCFPLLSDSQRALIVTWFRSILDTRDTSAAGTSSWLPENANGGDGMCLALAISGDVTDHDYVADLWTNNWNSTATKSNGWNFWNYHWVSLQDADCGSSEGWGYYTNNCQTNWATKGLWETAMAGGPGNGFLKIGWFDRYPLWFLFQHEPGFPKHGGFPCALATKNYEAGLTNARQAYDMLRAATSGPNGAIARYCLDQTFGYTGAVSTTGQLLVFGLLIGDPRVKGGDPATQGVPLLFTKQLGDVLVRSSWGTDATCLYFGNNLWAMRSVSPNGLALFKRVPLLTYRGALFAHTYEPGDFGNVVALYSGTQMAIVSQTRSTNNAVNTPAGTLVQNADGSWTGDAIKNYLALPGFKLSQIQRSLRTVSLAISPPASSGGSTPALSTITVIDDLACDASLTPHVVWNMPTQPTVNGRTIAFTGADGLTTCTLTMDQDVPQIKVIGGPQNYADSFDGTPPAVGALDADFPKLSPADQLHAGGYYRVHVVLPAGGTKLTTTIAVK